jgi:hypothetical protein
MKILCKEDFPRDVVGKFEKGLKSLKHFLPRFDLVLLLTLVVCHRIELLAATASCGVGVRKRCWWLRYQSIYMIKGFFRLAAR